MEVGLVLVVGGCQMEGTIGLGDVICGVEMWLITA